MSPLNPFLDDADLTLLNTHPNYFALHPEEFQLQPQQWTDFVKSANLGGRPPLSVDESVIKLPSDQGMSPKKRHEVAVMTAYVVSLIKNLPESPFIVDVGAGQGYLTRSLKHNLPQSHILALDADTAQSEGAKKWENKVLRLGPSDPPINHKTILITTNNLLAVISEWVLEKRSGKERSGPVPVLLLGLHACGSLTPDILRAYISSSRSKSASSLWYPSAVVAIGCCYNLMRAGDFPLSKRFSSYPALPVAAYHLAAQVPSTWLDSTGKPFASARLSIRKVVWRALLGRVLDEATPLLSENSTTLESKVNKSATVPARWSRRPDTWEAPIQLSEQSATAQTPIASITTSSEDDPSTGQTTSHVRLGRLSDAVYRTWPFFIEAASKKLGVIFPAYVNDLPIGSETDGLYLASAHLDETTISFQRLEKQLEVLHVKRCLLGPRVEESILDDRLEWFKEELCIDGGVEAGSDPVVSVDRINLFDQSLGSARNVAIVVTPAGCLPTFPATL